MEIIIVGTGNVAFQMGIKLSAKKMKIKGIIGRNKKEGNKLSKLIGSPYSYDFNSFKDKANIYLVAVNDEAIKKVAKKIAFPGATIIHTSGSVSIDAIECANKGVIWPLFSISKSVKVDWKKAPLIIESSNTKTKKVIESICQSLGGKIQSLNSEQRGHAHMLAVLMNNFSQHLFFLAKEHQSNHGIKPDIFDSIIDDTMNKIKSSDLKKSLTGPARRNDKNVIKNHLDILGDNPNLKKIYRDFTNSILQTYHGEKL